MIKTSSQADKVCVAKVHEADQDHVFEHWDQLGTEDQKALLAQLKAVDFQLLKRLVQQHIYEEGTTEERVLRPPRVEPLPSAVDEREDCELCRSLGEFAFRMDQVALVTCTGHAGPLDEPIGLLPVGPVTGKSVFQLHSEKVRAVNRRHRISIRWSIFCNPRHVETTRGFFKENGYFGLNCSDLHFFKQEQLPVVDRRGKILLSETGRLALASTGHGTILSQLLEDQHFKSLEKAGIKYILFFQADNPLARIYDPVFLGYHIRNRAEVSSKCVPKRNPCEPVGVFCEFNGAAGVVEFRELSEEDRERRAEDGSLVFSAAEIGNSIYSIDFLRQLKAQGVSLPYHAVPQISSYVNKRGRLVRPTEPNSIRFETYMFDALRDARRAPIVSVEREEEFSPIRNTGGKNSPQTAQRDLSHLYALWLKGACPETSPQNGKDIGRAVEISPLYAMDAAELKEKIEAPVDLTSDVLL